MEVIMSSPVDDCLGMDNDVSNAAVKLTKEQKKNMRKLKKKMKANQEDTENPKSKPEVHLNIISPSSLQDNPNTGLGIPAIVEQKMTVSSPASPGVKKSSIVGIENDNGNGTVKLDKSQKKDRRKAIKRKLNANLEDTEKSEEHTKLANGEMGSSVTTNLNAEVIVQNKMDMAIGETGSGTNTTDNTTSEKRKKKRSKNKNPDLSETFSTPESTQDMVLAKNDSIATTNVNVKGMAEEQNKMETAIGETGSGTNATDDTISKKLKRKRSKNKNPGLSEPFSTHESTQDMVLAKNDSIATTNVDVKGMAEEQNKMETVIGETGSDTNETDNTIPKKLKRKRSKDKNPDSSDILCTHESTQDTVIAKNDSFSTTNVNVKGVAEEQNEMETVIGETGSGTNATDNTISKKLKRKRLKNKNLDSSDIVSTHESTQDTVIAKNDSSATTNANMKGVAEEQNKPKSKRGSSSSGDIMNPQSLHNLEPSKGETGSGTTTTDNTSAKKRNRQKSKKTNPASGDILSTCESTEDMVITKKDSTTANVLEAVSDQMVSQGEEHVKGAILGVNDAGKMEKKKKSKKKRPTLGEDLNPQYLESSEAANSVENTDSTIHAKSAEVYHLVIAKADADRALIRHFWSQQKKKRNMRIKEVFQAATLGKKLIIMDVNGLLVDLVTPRPQDVIADVYIPRKAMFKRPFLEDFMCFCFERFNVAIWSSRNKDNLDLAVHLLLGDLKKKLLFVWDASKCTKTGIKTLEDNHKCIVLKDLRKIWVKGPFNESNTLLLDDSPYKALLNPKHNGIFPTSYSYKNRDDNFLGPKGELRSYLEGLAASDNVQTYVEQHPFGQGAIDGNSPDWGFYKRIITGEKHKYL